jgi:uncharacterized protein (TIGR01777 family)
MNVFIAGGTGFIGTGLTELLIQNGHSVTVLSRRPADSFRTRKGVTFIYGDGRKEGTWQNTVERQDAIFNLVGISIFRRWTAGNKQRIIDSRVLTTRNIVKTLQNRIQQDISLFNISGVGYYGHHGDEFLNENATPGNDFLAQLAVQWEKEALKAAQAGARVVVCRLGHVLGKEGGIVPRLAAISKLGLGGKWGNGQQWISWIHKTDLLDAMLFLLNRTNIEGAVNVCSPNPVRNTAMMETFADILSTGTIVKKIPAFLLRLLLGEFASAFLNGQRVTPQKLTDTKFQFSFPYIKESLKDLLT